MGFDSTQFLHWPYDEVSVSQGPGAQEFQVKAPWVTLSIEADELSFDRTREIAQKIEAQNLTAEDLPELTWFFRALSDYPFAYNLPRAEFTATDTHSLQDRSLLALSPPQFLNSCVERYFDSQLELRPDFSTTIREKNWSWDLEASLQFSQSTEGFDPYTLLSLARRFHLIDTLHTTRIPETFQVALKLKGDADRFQKACALIVRQNHYVTQQCNPSLAPAVDIAQSARTDVEEFMASEQGHDQLLGRAVSALGEEPENVAVVPSAKALMALLKFSASRNLLGFAMIVDIFERSSYAEQDPMATLLSEGGYEKAAKHIDLHKGINDAGSHENMSLTFVAQMKAVDAAYAEEALRLAEMATFLIQTISEELLEKVQKV